MFNITIDALKWIWAQLRRLGWAGVILGIGSVIFLVWNSLPDDTKLRMINAIAPPSAKKAAIDVAVTEFKIETPDDPDLLWLRNKIERNLVELLAENGQRVAHPLAVLSEGAGSHARFQGALGKIGGDNVEIAARLEDAKGRTVSSVSFEAPASLLRENYKVIPETIIHGLDVSPRSLRPLNKMGAPRETGGTRTLASPRRIPLPAMLLFFEARRKAGQNAIDEALSRLKQAIEIAPRFAMAYWAIGELEKLQGNDSAASDWAQRALKIDLDHQKLPIVPVVAQPLSDLLPALKAAQWTKAADGFETRRLQSSAYDVAIDAWRLDADRARLEILQKKAAQGSSVDELRKASAAALVVNGGFFEIDAERRLTPSGLLISSGSRIGAYNPSAGSAILFSSNGRIGIGWSRNWDNMGPLEEAIQAGPMTVDPGGENGIKSNDYNRHNRTAVCLTGSHVVAVVVTGGLSLFELGAILAAPERDGGFGCERAINLDGGPSTQASFAFGDAKLEIEGTWRVENAVAFSLKHNANSKK